MPKPVSPQALEDLMDGGDVDEALRRGLRAVEDGSRDPGILAAVAEASLRRGDRMQAVALARRAVAADSGSAQAPFRLGQCLQFLTEEASEADAEFATAARLDPDTYVVPYRVPPERFDALAQQAVTELRRSWKRLLDARGTTVGVVPLPDLERVTRENGDPFALVHHIGNPLGLPNQQWYGPWYRSEVDVADVIELHQLGIENWCADEADLRREIAGAVRDGVREAFALEGADSEGEDSSG